jgi:transposase
MRPPTLSYLRRAHARTSGGWVNDPEASDLLDELDDDGRRLVDILWDMSYEAAAHRYAQWHELPRHMVDRLAATPPMEDAP